MSRFVLWFGIFGLIVGSLHVYLWWRLVRDTSMPHPWRRLVTRAIGALGVAVLGSFFLMRELPVTAQRVLLFPVYLWMGAVFYLFVMFLSADVLRGAVRLTRRNGAPANPDRRRFLARVIGGGATASFGGIAVIGARRALSLDELRTEKIEVALRRLPREMDGFRIVQISDLHLGPTLGRDWCAGVVERVNALNPDLIAITGDVIDGVVEDLRDDVEPLRDLRAPQGVFFCTGNHEYYFGPEAWCEYLPKLGIRVLRNERVAVGGFDLVGIDDYRSRGMAAGHGPDLAKALAGRSPDREVVLLAHQPVAVLEAASHDVGLQLSGHTHGGQMWPFHYLVKIAQPYVAGLVNHKGTMLYVNQGTGFWGPPIRIGSYAEITHVTLRTIRAT